MPAHKSLYGALFASATAHSGWWSHENKEIAPSMLDESHHHTKRETHKSIFSNMNLDILHWFDHKNTDKKSSGWHFPNPFEGLKQYARWGRIEFIDEEGTTVDLKFGQEESDETNMIFKWYEEKTQKYLAYEAAAKKFLPEDDYNKKGKCPIMSLLTSESQVDAKMNEQ